MAEAAEFSGGDVRSRLCCREKPTPFFSRKHHALQGSVRRATGQNIGVWWGYINDLVAHGHGPLQNILDNYTLTHLNKFLQEIDNRARRQRITDAYIARLANATVKGFKEAIREMERHDRDIRRRQAHAEGRRLDLEPNEVEAEILDSQKHHYFSDLSPDEQDRFKREQERLWATIPAEFRDRAERMAKGGWN